jgi:serine/threonine-protein kinase ULK/ATG1
MKKVGNYVLVSKIGEGQFGMVYKATDQDTDEVYAVKAINKAKVNSNSKLRKLFDTEMAVMSMIDHPNVLHLHEYLETTNNYYLVIQFCNNGDLEAHVEKNKFLGEEESVYFLMQVMNGFKELHKHKIMHRDFKLANIFLNDDNIVIGDFGFAKSGADVAETKLGSPITMAPELLNPKDGKVRYNNKADLWSIGVCFFQMIFGKVPWAATTMQELQALVQEQNGDTLVIPSEPSISPECEDLLRKLMTYESAERISWDDFFKHPIFEKKAAEGAELRASVMFRNYEEDVAKMFRSNRDEGAQEVDLVDPLEMELGAAVNDKPKDESPEKKLKRAIRRARQRFTHEKKIIVFLMHTCRKLRNLAKQKEALGSGVPSLMFASLLLLRKGINHNERLMAAIESSNNMFGLDSYEEFLKSDNCAMIIKELTKDNKLYYTLLSHLQKKLKDEVGFDNPRAATIRDLSGTEGLDDDVLAKEISIDGKACFELWAAKNGSLDGEFKKEMALGMAHLYMSERSEAEFSFKKNGILFDWNDFEKKLDIDYVNSVIERGLKEL